MSERQSGSGAEWYRPRLSWLLVFAPLAAVAEWRHVSPTLTFLFACLAIIPLAGLMGQATEQVAKRTGEGIGGFLNATFGNAAELIIGIMALKEGLHDVVKASLTGSIIGNVLLVLGISLVAGGATRERQTFNRTAASSGATMLSLSAVALVLPAVYAWIAEGGFEHHELQGPAGITIAQLSLAIAVVLIVTYGLSLLFSLKTHRHLYIGKARDSAEDDHAQWSLRRAVGALLAAAVGTAVMSEILVKAVEPAAEALGLTEVFVGVIIVAIIGNAAEHSSGVWMAVKDRMDLSLGIAIGSSMQVALFVAPLLLFISYLFGSPMDLVFSPMEVLAVALSVMILAQIADDGESNWLEGAQLLSLYVILALVFYFVR